MDLERIRAETNCRQVYLDHTAASVPPRPVLEAASKYLDEIGEAGPKDFALIEKHYRALEETRSAVARLINARSASAIALFPSGSDAISAAAGALDWAEGDEIILSEAEMISNVAPWLRLRDRLGAVIRVAPITMPGLIDVDAVRRLVTPRTKVISLTHVPNTLGVAQPLEEVGRIAREDGVLFLVDAAASVGVVPVDVERLGCHLLVGTGRKYLRGLAGSAFLYCNPQVLDRLQPWAFGWKSGAWDWNAGTLTFLPDASRFHVGEPNFPSWIALGTAVRYAFEVGGIETIWSRVRELSASLLERLRRLKRLRVLGPGEVEARSGIIMVDIEGVSPKIAADFLQARGVVAEGGHGYCPGPLRFYGAEMALRLALHYWNTEEDLDTTVALLAKLAA